MRDFTPQAYQSLLQHFLQAGFALISFRTYLENPPRKPFVILRHDVDLHPERSLVLAQVEHDLSVQASYYFRVVPASNQPMYIRQIAALGHEIGYHYEDMALTHGDTLDAIRHFEHWLTYFRQFYPVVTICMHGAPTSQYDGRVLWQQYDYRQYGIIGEPYFDVNFNQIFYLTDTGRCFDGFRFSVRDKVPQQTQWAKSGLLCHSTADVIAQIPTIAQGFQGVMLTTHPQRWIAARVPWYAEWLSQKIKNAIKRILIWFAK